MRTASRKGPNIKKKGAPTHDVVGMKDAHTERLEETNELEDKYLAGEDEPAENVVMRHRNRNLDKPDIDKPAYS